MSRADRGRLTLTRSQADCLMVLRNPVFSPGRTAVAAKLDLDRTDAALRKLEEFGLVRRNDAIHWSATGSGVTCEFETIADPRVRRGRPPRPGAQSLFDFMDEPTGGPGSAQPGPSARLLLDLLDRPKSAVALARESGLSRERVRQLLVRLHALRLVAFADLDHPSWLIRRESDDRLVLSRTETRVLSALPSGCVVDIEGLGTATKLPIA